MKKFLALMAALLLVGCATPAPMTQYEVDARVASYMEVYDKWAYCRAVYQASPKHIMVHMGWNPEKYDRTAPPKHYMQSDLAYNECWRVLPEA